MKRYGLTLLAIAAACRTWTAQSGAPMSAVQGAIADSTETIRLTTASGSVIEISEPSIVNDSVVGLNSHSRQRVAVSVADVRSVERQEPNAGRTALAVYGVILGTVALLVGAVVIGLSGQRPN